MQLAGDRSCCDPARMFYGNTSCTFETFDRGIPTDVLDDLIAQGRNANIEISLDGRKVSFTQRSPLRFPQEILVRKEKGGWEHLDQLPRSTRIHCQFHHDENASAVVFEGYQRVKGFYCSACATSFWPSSTTNVFDFGSFDRMARGIVSHTASIDDYLAHVLAVRDGEMLRQANITFLADRYISDLRTGPGVTFIKSPKGTGKTEFLKELVANNPKAKFLLVGHRRSLIGEMCNRLGLNCYLLDENGLSQNDRRKHRYGVCLDSIFKVAADRKFDYILIDECEQVLSHLLSTTLGDKRLAVYQRLRALVSGARHVVALDADLNWPSFLTLSEWYRTHKPDAKSHVYINEFQPKRSVSLELFASRNQITADLERSIRENKRCFVVSNSRKRIEKLVAGLRKKHPDRKILAITSKTSTNEEAQKFLENPGVRSLEYDCILASPSISTGVDITFPDESAEFDVYGLFEPLVLSHFEIDQQLSRVRHPRSLRVFISPQLFAFETNYDVVMNDTLALPMMAHVIEGYDLHGKPNYKENDPFVLLAARLLTQRRGSLNSLAKNFIDMKKQQGWSITRIEKDDTSEKTGSDLMKLGAELSKQQNIELLMSAQVPSPERLQEIFEKRSNKLRLSDAEYAGYVRYKIESFYRKPISPALIELDDNGRFRVRAQNYDYATSTLTRGILNDALDDNHGDQFDRIILSRNRLEKANFALRALRKATVFGPNGFVRGRVITSPGDDLKEFIIFMRDNRVSFELLFDQTIREDLERKPMSQLNPLLQFFGLKAKRIGMSRRGAVSCYRYQIPASAFDTLDDIVGNRRPEHATIVQDVYDEEWDYDWDDYE